MYPICSFLKNKIFPCLENDRNIIWHIFTCKLEGTDSFYQVIILTNPPSLSIISRFSNRLLSWGLINTFCKLNILRMWPFKRALFWWMLSHIWDKTYDSTDLPLSLLFENFLLSVSFDDYISNSDKKCYLVIFLCKWLSMINSGPTIESISLSF